MSDNAEAAPPSLQAFQIGADFAAGEQGGGLTLGALELQYQELFAEALADGVITSEERERLDKAADNLGLDRQRLSRLESAMVAAYEGHHRVKVVERWEQPPQSLAPLEVDAAGDAGRTLLLKRIEQLEARIVELEAELREAHANINVEVDLSDLSTTEDVDEADPDLLLKRVSRDPTNVDALHALFAAFAAKGDVDRQFCISQALHLLNAANEKEQAAFETHRQTHLMTPKAAISQQAWVDHLFHPEQEPLTSQIFSVITPAVLLGRVATLRREKKLRAPDESQRQEPDKSTITAVRAVTWAATLLGLATPRIYLDKERDAGYLLVPNMPPYTTVGKGVLSGRSQLELAFLAGRHLAGFRQELFIKQLYNAVPDLEDLFLAALLIGSPGLPVAEDVKKRVTPLAKAIEPMLEPNQIDTLRGFFMRFVDEGGRTNLQRWSSAAEKTASRVGFVLCNDLPTAAKVLDGAQAEPSEQTRELIAFAVSDRYSRLRKQLGIAVAS